MPGMLTARIRRSPETDEQPTEELETLSNEPGADDAALDSLRGDLVRALDRFAEEDQASSACFRRI